LLAPYGAFDEPNNRRHLPEIKVETGLSEHGKFWHDNAVKMHQLLLLTTDVIDILMGYRNTEEDFEREVRRMVANLIAVIPTREGTSLELEPIRVSSDFTHAFCLGSEAPASNFCKEQLLWTFPDSKHLEAYSSGNLSGCYENRSFYDSCLKHIGVKRFVLNQKFLNAMLAEYDKLKPDDRVPVARTEPSFFKTDTVQIPAKAEDLEVFFRHFYSILWNRLFSDAYMTSVAGEDYYSKLSEKIETIREFSDAVEAPKGIIHAASRQIEFSQVRERGGLANREQYLKAFMRVYSEPESEDQVDSDGSRSSVDPENIVFQPRRPRPAGPEDDPERRPVRPAVPAPHDGPERRPIRPAVPAPADGPGRLPVRPPVPVPDGGPGRRPVHPLLPEPYDDPDGFDVLPVGGRDEHYVYPPREQEDHYDDGGDGYRDRRRPSYGPPEEPVGYDNPEVREMAKNIEIVVLRPNIEHYMLGIIMGLAGEQLGNTLWGQTELSVYDDSMHGVWGMSYK
jgi:hypothetical protein